MCPRSGTCNSSPPLPPWGPGSLSLSFSPLPPLRPLRLFIRHALLYHLFTSVQFGAWDNDWLRGLIAIAEVEVEGEVDGEAGAGSSFVGLA